MELELKYKVVGDYTQTLLEAGFTFKKSKHQIDTYYLIGDVLREKPVYLRLRQDFMEDKYSLDFHEVISNLATKETELDLGNKEDFEKVSYMLNGLNLSPKCVVRKKRKVFEKEPVTAVLDEIEGLGFFVELEMEGIENEKTAKELKSLAAALKLQEQNLVEGIGYPELLLNHNHREAGPKTAHRPS